MVMLHGSLHRLGKASELVGRNGNAVLLASDTAALGIEQTVGRNPFGVFDEPVKGTRHSYQIRRFDALGIGTIADQFRADLKTHIPALPNENRPFPTL